ncbi:response regulator [Bacillus sp. REN10]|uniref:response regulator n=1 Tax=Bacillus sp. REN10 TaxID=2782541 RepID=UPI0031B62B1A
MLIAEDDPMVAQINKQYAEAIPGFYVQKIVTSPEAAMQAIETNRPDLLLLDIYMPGMSGLELLKNIRLLNKSIDVIVISAANDMLSVRKALHYGAVDYLMKPFQFDRFEQALLSYQQRYEIYARSDEVNQGEIDELFFSREKKAVRQVLPKGLTKETLKLVWLSVEKWPEEDFSAEDIAFHSGVSRVSVRKYLSFLQEIGVLEERISYGSVGRPQTRCRIVNEKRSKVHQYID